MIGINKSVSKFVGASCNIETTLSSPIPVSIFLFGNGSYVPSSLWLNSENTRFHISSHLSFSPPGKFSGSSFGK